MSDFVANNFLKCEVSGVMRLTLLYNDSGAVIPAKAGIQLRNTGFRIKPGMTDKGKGLLAHYTSDDF